MNATTPHLPISSKTFLGLLAAICALAILAVPAAAGTADSDSAPEASLTFPTGEAHLSGSQTSVWVTCQAPEESVCNGTLTLTRSGNKAQVPFSVIAGTNQSLSVPLALDPTAKRVVAVVKTAQADGTYLRTRQVLHIG